MEPWNKEYLELVTPEVSQLLWDSIHEANSQGLDIVCPSKLLHEGAKELGRAIRDQHLQPDQAKVLARRIVLPYARGL